MSFGLCLAHPTCSSIQYCWKSVTEILYTLSRTTLLWIVSCLSCFLRFFFFFESREHGHLFLLFFGHSPQIAYASRVTSFELYLLLLDDINSSHSCIFYILAIVSSLSTLLILLFTDTIRGKSSLPPFVHCLSTCSLL